MAKVHEEYIKSIFINEQIVIPASELVRILCDEFKNCTHSNARKIIETATKNGIIKSSKPITFGHNQYAYYNPVKELKKDDIKMLLVNRPNIKRILNRMDENKGVISYIEILKLAACTIGETKTKCTKFLDICSLLENLEVAKKYSWSGVCFLVYKDLTESAIINAIKDDLYYQKLDCMFIPVFLIWLQKHNIMDNGGLIYRNKNNPCSGVTYNNLMWDAIGYTRTTGYYDFIGDNSENKKTLVVLDIRINNQYTQDDLYGFYDRIQINRNSVKGGNERRKILPIILARDINNEAKIIARKMNILMFNLGIVYGERIFEIIDKMQKVSLPSALLGNNMINDDYIVDNVGAALSALKESGQEINLNNLKGELFERLMYYVVMVIYEGKILGELRPNYHYNQTIEGKHIGYEYDIIAETKDEYIVFELKGYKGSSNILLGEYDEKTEKPEKNTIKWFFSNSFPFIKENLEINPFNKKVKACYITTALFEKEALCKLNELNQSNLKPKELDLFYDGKKLLELLSKYNLKKEKNVVEQYYEVIS